ncbi:MogA/MoaB family molybdenum cofactor biosynthesis protein [Candidatus Nitrospira bockiana]
MLRVSILVVSTKILAQEEPDRGRDDLEQIVRNLPATVISYDVVPDDRKWIRDQLIRVCDDHGPDVLLTIGGTGVRPSDWTPEATRDVIDKEIPGMAEAMRQESLKKVRTAMLSRATAGIRKHTLIINLPGSPKGVKENLSVILPVLDHAVEKIRSDRRDE